MSSIVLKSGYVGISSQHLTDDITEKASEKQTIIPELQGQMCSANSLWFTQCPRTQAWNLLAVSKIFILVITHILYSTKNQFSHSFQNTMTQTTLTEDVELSVSLFYCVWSISATQRKREAHSHKCTLSHTGGFCL